MERLPLTRLTVTVKSIIPRRLEELSSWIDAVLPDLTIDETFWKSYKKFRESARKGNHGKTAQFWLLYMDLAKYQIMAHTAIQENDLSTLFHCWKKFLPMYFMMNKVHYTRYNPDSSPFFAMSSLENSSVCRNRNLKFFNTKFWFWYLGIVHFTFYSWKIWRRNFQPTLRFARKWVVSPSTRQITTCYCCWPKREANH